VLAVKAPELATPLEFVVTVMAVPPPVKVPLAPEPGAVNVTDAPLTGFKKLSFTVAVRAVDNAVLMTVVCDPPLVAVIDAGAPAVFVRLKLAEVAPVADAVTL
jgi:hypothetical protein